MFSRARTIFSKAASISMIPGPIIESLPTSPYVPGVGKEKAHGSYQWTALPTGVPAARPVQPAEPPLVGFALKPGFKFGRSDRAAASSLDTDVDNWAVNGRPEAKVPMLSTVQSAATAFKNAELGLNGIG